MKGLTLVGAILLGISGLLFYITTDFLVEKITMSHIMGIMGGIGIGLIIGGIVGYVSKGSAIKEEEIKRQIAKKQEEIKRQIAKLQNDKYELQQKVNQKNQENIE